MDKPTCKTCPFWHHHKLDPIPIEEGTCVRFPPEYVGPPVSPGASETVQRDNWSQPFTSERDTCGGHPGYRDYHEKRNTVRSAVDWKVDGVSTIRAWSVAFPDVFATDHPMILENTIAKDRAGAIARFIEWEAGRETPFGSWAKARKDGYRTVPVLITSAVPANPSELPNS